MGALFIAGLTTFVMGISAGWATDLEVIQTGVTSPTLIDVRTEKEFDAGALNGALNHPFRGYPIPFSSPVSLWMTRSLFTAEADDALRKLKRD